MMVSLDTNSLLVSYPIIPFSWVSDSTLPPGQVPPCPLWAQWDKTPLSLGCTVSWEGQDRSCFSFGKVRLGVLGRLC